MEKISDKFGSTLNKAPLFKKLPETLFSFHFHIEMFWPGQISQLLNFFSSKLLNFISWALWLRH